MQTIQQQTNLLLPTCKGIEVIIPGNIIRIEGSSNYSKLFFLDGKTLVVAKLLKWFEEKLKENQFYRVHKTHFINTNFILQYSKGTDSKVELSNGEWIKISKRKKQQFIKYWLAL